MLLKLWISWRYGDRVIDILIWYGFHDGRIIDILITRSSALKCISSDVGRLAIEQTLTFNPIQVVQILTNVNDENDFNHKRIAKFSFCSKMNWKMCQDSFKMFQFCTSLPLLQCQYHFSAKWFLAWSLKHSKQRGWKQTSAKNILWSSNATAGSLPVMNAPITVTFKEPPCDGGRCDLTNKRQRQMHPTNDQQKDLMHPITNNCYI